jgi:hypothetical protein
MKRIIPGCIIICLILAACSSKDKKADKGKDKYEQTKESLEETEKKNPERFLTVSSHDHRNIIGQTVIKGTVSNSAKVASFTDVDVELSFYSKTGALLEKDHEVVYETIAPGSSASFKTKYFAPKGTDSIAMKVSGVKKK